MVSLCLGGWFLERLKLESPGASILCNGLISLLCMKNGYESCSIAWRKQETAPRITFCSSRDRQGLSLHRELGLFNY